MHGTAGSPRLRAEGPAPSAGPKPFSRPPALSGPVHPDPRDPRDPLDVPRRGPLGPLPHVRTFHLSDETPTGPQADQARTARDRLSGAGLDDAVVAVRHGPRLILAHGSDLAEVADVDPVRGVALSIGPAGTPVDVVLLWLAARAFPDDHAFVQVRVAGDDLEPLVGTAQRLGWSVATDVDKGSDPLQTHLNTLKAWKGRDLVATRATGVLLKDADPERAAERLAGLMEGRPEEGG